MATRKRSAARTEHSPSLAPTISVLSVVIGLVLLVGFSLPGPVVVWLGFVIAAWLHPRAELTGRKDKNGYATASHPGEEVALRRYRMWSDLKWRMFTPTMDWWIGWPVFASSLLAVWCAVFAWHFDHYFSPVSAAVAYITVTQVSASRRRNSNLGEPCPGARFDTGFPKDQILTFALSVVGGAAVAGLVGFALTFAPFVDVGRTDLVILALGGAIIGFLPWWSNVTLADWRELVAARGEWKPRWEMLKNDPAPYLISRDHIGEVTVDTFDAPASSGAIAFYSLGPKLVPTIGTNTRLFVLPTENVDGDGKPIQGSQHPLRFRVVTMESDGMPDLTDYDLPEDQARIALECGVVGTLMEMGAAAPFIGNITPIHDLSEPEPEPEMEGPDDEFDLDLDSLPAHVRQRILMEREMQGENQAPPPPSGPPPGAAWMVEVLVPQGPPLKWMHMEAEDAIGGALGCEAVIDFRNYEALFIGVLTHPDQRFIDTTDMAHGKRVRDVHTTLERIDNERLWRSRWEGVLKTNVNFPAIEHDQYFEYTLSDGSVIHSQTFVTLKGDELGMYFGNEARLATALEFMPFVSICGFLSRGQRRGERHPQAFTVLWSSDTLPPNPEKLRPPRITGGAVPQGELSLLRGRVNEAFKAARLAQPEVTEVKCLTDQRSRGHIWRIAIRTYGGVTLADVRGAAHRIKQAWGCSWLRVTEPPNGDGVVIVAGAPPHRVTPANESVTPLLVSLDWEQAWLDAKISGVGGLTPTLRNVDTLPDNKQVKVLDFDLPSGLSLSDVRSARTKLEASTSNGFIEIRPHPDKNPAHIQVYAAETSPMPPMIEFDFAYSDRDDLKGLPFATGIEGRPIGWDMRSNPHLLILGGSGGGKENPLTTRVPVPVSERFPDGWATVGTLVAGDQVYAADGSLTTVTGFSDVREQDVYRFTLSDGQTVEAGPDHLWKISDIDSRGTHGAWATRRRDAFRSHYYEQARELRILAEIIPHGTVATIPDIAALTPCDYAVLHQMGIPKELSVLAQVPTKKKARLFSVDQFVGYFENMMTKHANYTIGGCRITEQHLAWLCEAGAANGGHLTIRAVADAVLGRETSRNERDAFKNIAARQGFDSVDGFATATVPVYPVDEVLFLLADHLEFRTATRGGREPMPLERIVTSRELAELINHDRAMSPAVRVTGVRGATAELPIAPYTLGAWLGDGHYASGGLTGIDSEIWDQVECEGYEVTHSATVTSQHYIKGIFRAIRVLDVYDNKHIPAMYLRADREQRLALLQGLMDTDGTVDESGGCELSLSDRRLAGDALELIRSLGIKASISWDQPASYRDEDGNIVPCKNRHRIHFTTTTPVFRMTRKVQRQKDEVRSTQDWIYFTAVEVSEPVPMRCIKVDHVEHLYLMDHFIPTHNSVTAQGLMYGAVLADADVVMIDVQKQGADFKFAENQCAAFVKELEDAEATMKALYAEVKRRARLNGEHGVAHSSELPEAPKPIVIFIDEFLGLIMAGKRPPSQPEENPELERQRLAKLKDYNAKKQIGFITGRIAAEARSADVHLVLMTQKLTASSLDDDLRDLKTNLARIVLGKTTYGERMSALRDAENAPDLGEVVPKGRGIYESVVDAAQQAQFWFASASTYEAELARRIPRIDPSRVLDYSSFLVNDDPQESAVLGERIEPSGPVAASPTRRPQEVDLGTLDLGDDLDFSLDDDLDDDEGEVDLSALGIEIVGLDDDEDGDESNPSDSAGDLDWGVELSSELDTQGEPELDWGDSTEPEPEPVMADPTSDVLDMETALLPDVADEDSLYGWGLLDALYEYLSENPHIKTVRWDEEAMTMPFAGSGVSYAEMIADVVGQLGVVFEGPAWNETPEPEPAPDLFVEPQPEPVESEPTGDTTPTPTPVAEPAPSFDDGFDDFGPAPVRK